MIIINNIDKIVFVSAAKEDETSVHEGADITMIFVVYVQSMEVFLHFERGLRVYAKIREMLVLRRSEMIQYGGLPYHSYRTSS